MTQALLAFFTAGIVLDHAHLFSPITLAWTNAACRRRMLERWWKYILWPVALLAISVGIGLSSDSTKDPIFRVLALAYYWWNAIHFGMQHYGVCRILGWRKQWQTDLAMVVAVTPLVWLAPPWWLVWGGFLVSFLHWITDIGLCTKSARFWLLFGGVMLLAGFFSGFWWKRVFPPACGPMYTMCVQQTAIPWLLGIRYGLGFDHFLYSRWVWQEPDVRAIVGRAVIRFKEFGHVGSPQGAWSPLDRWGVSPPRLCLGLRRRSGGTWRKRVGYRGARTA